MTAYRELEDGTRVYARGVKYTPVKFSERKYKIRKPQDPRAVRWKGEWFIPLDLVNESERVMPSTRPDEQAYEHALIKGRCRCVVCRRPEAKRWRKRGLRERRRAKATLALHPQSHHQTEHHPQVAGRSAESTEGLSPGSPE